MGKIPEIRNLIHHEITLYIRYASNLLLTMNLETSNKWLLGMLFLRRYTRQLLGLGAAFSLGNATAARSILRDSVEVSIQMRYALVGDHELKAIAVAYCQERDKRAWQDTAMKTDLMAGKQRPPSTTNQDSAKDHALRYDRLKKHVVEEKLLKRAKWYTIVDPQVRKLERLAQEIGDQDMYDLHYRLLSASAHNQDLHRSEYEHSNGQLTFFDLTFPFGLASIYTLASSSLLFTLLDVEKNIFGTVSKTTAQLMSDIKVVQEQLRPLLYEQPSLWE